MRTMIWAHRGASAYAPENSMEAFELAHKMGADGIELDVHLTSDNHLVVAHDETVDRCSNGSGRIVDKTLSELLELDFSNNKKDYSNIRIPTLEQVLDFIKQTNMILNIEIKNGVVFYKNIEEKILNSVKRHSLLDRVVFSSFNHYSLTVLKKLDAKAKIGVLYTEALIDPHLYAKHVNAMAIHPYYLTLMVPDTVWLCKIKNIKVHAWGVDTEKDILWMLNQEVDAIITNHPDIAVKLRGSIQDQE